MLWKVRHRLAQWLIDPRGVIKKHAKDQPAINLCGDRDIEWTWVMANLPEGRGENALDFGNGGSPLGLASAMRGYNVTAVDLCNVEWLYEHPNLHFVRGDILKMDLPSRSFNLVINCSTVEHVGLPNRFGVIDNLDDGDLMAMQRLRELMKPGAIMLLTVPVGRDEVFPPMCRIYGQERLPKLLAGYKVYKEQFWLKNEQNKWTISKRDVSLAYRTYGGDLDPHRNWMGLGCFFLGVS